MTYICRHRSTAVILLLNINWIGAKCRCNHRSTAVMLLFKYIGLRQSVDANLLIGSPYGNFSEKEKFPKFYFTDYLRSLTYRIGGNFFQVSFGFVNSQEICST